MNFYNHRKLGFIYVGIDCHKATHTAVIISPFNDKLDTLTLKNTKEDFNKLLDMVSKYTSKDVSAIFGLEDTKHLGHSLCEFLLSHNQVVKHVNSNYTYNERKKHPIIDKTDELDAECIAKVTLDELDNLPDAKDDEIYWTLKQLIKMKRTISNNNTKLKNKLHAQLLHHYPNYKEFFSKIDNISALDFWETYPSPNMIKDLTVEELKEGLNTKGKFPLNKANKILGLIKDYDYKEMIYQNKETELPHFVRFESDQMQIEALLKLVTDNEGRNIGVLLPNNSDVIRIGQEFSNNNVECEFKYNKGENDFDYVDTINFNTTLPKIMTYHSAKGLQFDLVILPMYVGANNDESKKALYVAMTRTMHSLYVLYSTSQLLPPLNVPSHLYLKE